MVQNDIIQYLKKNKDNYGNNYNIMLIGIFGSFARNQQSEQSDIDILYSTMGGEKIKFSALYELLQELELHFNRKIELVNIKYMNPIIMYKAQNEIIYV